MNPDDALRRVAPCGLDCGKCVAFRGGPIADHAKALQDLLGPNFTAYAERFAAMNPVFQGYPPFRDLLDFLASGSCGGCRESGCLFKACKVTACVRERGVDFCHQCPDFPCADHGMPPALAPRWRRNNELIRDLGLAAYFAELKDRPRYP